MLLWLAFAFMPAPAPLPSGPPTIHLDRTPAVQWSLSGSPRARAFSAMWGETWFRWDERTGNPRFLGLPGVPEADAAAVVADVARLSGVDPAELSLAGSRSHLTKNGSRTIYRFARAWRGVPVEGDEVLAVATNGSIGAAWVRLTPIAGLPTPRRGEVVVADPDRGYGRLATVTRAADVVRAVDRDGREVYAYDPRRFADVQVEHEEYTVGDALVTDPARGITVTDASGATATTADDGSHGLSGALSVELNGDTLQVLQNGASITATGTDDFTLVANEDVSYSAADTLHHFHAVWDWLGDRWPTHPWLTGKVIAEVDLTSGACNAYYSSSTINFYAAYSYCNATGRIASVIYHETGHGIHEYILAGGTFASDVSEGSADFVSATILDDAVISRGFYTDGSAIRELDTDKKYPDDVTGEVHNDGLIWGSFLWDLREQWSATYGDSLGVEMTDELFLGALEQGPELTDLMEAVLVADDDDGDWSTGTPHDCELMDLLDVHGLGPGVFGVYVPTLTPLGPQASDTEGYPLEVDVNAAFSSCTGITAPTPSIWFTEDTKAPIPGTDGTGWERWTSLPLTSTDGNAYTGTLPRLPVPASYRYFYAMTSADGTETEYSHGGYDSGLYQFWIGDRALLWCDDFETGGVAFTHGAGVPWNGATGTTDEWTFGTPSGTATLDPDLAVSGTTIATTVLDGNYSPNNAQYLLSPDVDLSTPGRMRLLTYQRWLTVEDAIYDHARVWAVSGGTGTTIWENQATSGGSHQWIDADWTTVDHDLRPLLDEEGAASAPIGFGFSLQSDPGLEFGGWALDDVCVVELDDIPGHYRRVDLTAAWTDAGEADVGTVDVSWHTPWIKPLTATVLVRQAGRAPADLDDGVILDLDLSPAFGEAKSVVDDLPGLDRGTTWTYALFAVGEDDTEVYTAAVDGENAATLDFPIRDTGKPLDTGDSGDTAADTSDSASPDSGDSADPGDTGASGDTGTEPQPGCGCASTPEGAAGAFGVLVAGTIAARRRRATRR